MMYVLQVLTGRETEICGKLRRAGISAYCPQERRQIRRGGRWQERYRAVQRPDRCSQLRPRHGLPLHP